MISFMSQIIPFDFLLDTLDYFLNKPDISANEDNLLLQPSTDPMQRINTAVSVERRQTLFQRGDPTAVQHY